MIYKTPKSLEDLLEQLSKEEDQYHLLAGGTDLMPQINKHRLDGTIYDLGVLSKQLDFIEEREDEIEIGALVTHTKVVGDQRIQQHFPHLRKAVDSIGSRQVRNMGTLVGNLANASPVGDSIPALLTTDSGLKVVSTEGERTIKLVDFFVGYKKTAIKKGELIKSIVIKKELWKDCDFFKVSIRPDMTVSKCSLAFTRTNEDFFRIAVGGVADRPIRLKEIEKYENNKVLNQESLSELLKREISPISDYRSTSEYRFNSILQILLPILQR